MTRAVGRRIGIGLSLLATIELVTGFGTQTLIVAVVGANHYSDAYFIAMALPQFFIAVVAAPIVSVIIPLLATSDAERFRAQATVALAWATGVAAICAVIGAATSVFWVPALFPGFTDSEQPLVLQLALVQLLSLAPTTGCMIWKAACYSRRRFLAAEAISVTGAMCSFVALIVTLPRYGVVAAVWINVVRYTVTLVALIALERTAPPEPARGEFVRRLWNRTQPLMVGALYYKTEPLVDQHFASMARPGDLSIFSFARTLLASGLLVLTQALIAPIIPEMAVLAKEAEWLRLRARMHQRMIAVCAVATVGVLMIAILGPGIIDFASSHWPRIAAMPLHKLWALLLLLAGIPIAAGAGQIVTSTYYVIGETRLLTQIGMINYTVGVMVKLIGFTTYGLWGLAVATSGYFILDVTVQWIVLERRIHRAIKTPQVSETTVPTESS